MRLQVPRVGDDEALMSLRSSCRRTYGAQTCPCRRRRWRRSEVPRPRVPCLGRLMTTLRRLAVGACRAATARLEILLEKNVKIE